MISYQSLLLSTIVLNDNRDCAYVHTYVHTDEQVNAQNESLSDAKEGRSLKGTCRKLISWTSNDFKSTILDTMKVLFI